MTSTPPPPHDPAGSGQGEYPAYPIGGAGQPAGPPGPGGYPTHPGTPPPGGGTRPDVPQPPSIRNAVRLMWVGAGLSVVGLIVTLATIDSLKSQLRDSLEKSDPDYTQSEFDAFFTISITIAVIVSVVSVALWLWMAWKNGQGRSWARVVATVLGGLSLLSALATIAAGSATGVSIAVTLAGVLLAVVILVLLWRKESSDFYAARSRPQWG